MTKERILGVISDTHGLVRAGAIRMLQGCDTIFHAGDIGTPEVLETLRAIAPVIAVRGNTDHGSWSSCLHEQETAEINGMLFHILHDLSRIDLDPHTAGIRAVISGHSHRPLMDERSGILYLNPGSAGPRRFSLPVTAALIHMHGRRLRSEIIHLDRESQDQQG